MLGFKPIPAAVSLAIYLIIRYIIPIPADVSPEGWQLLAMFVAVISAIIGKVMPLGALSLMAIMLVALTQVTADSSGKAIKDALSSFSNGLIWLIGFSIMISRGLIKSGLGSRIGYTFIALFGKSTLGVAYSLAFSELTLAPITPSNTARCGGIIHPIMRAIAKSYDSDPEHGTEGKIGKFLALSNYHCNPISSTMFITATAPNPLVVKLVADATGAEINLTWGTWALAMLLPGIVAMMVMPLVIYWLYPPEIKKTPNAAEFAKEKIAALGPMTRPEWIMLGVFGILLFLWAGVPALIFGPEYTVNATTTALLGVVLLLVTGVLTWDDVLKEKSAWDTVVWFSALVMMANYLNKLGIVAWFAGSLKVGITNMGVGWVAASLLLVIAYMYAHYFFASTTAHISAMFGAFYMTGISLGAPPMLFALMMASASSLMMTLTHYATGTSPVIFGSGYTTLGEWWKAGAVMSVVNLVIFLGLGGVWWKILGFW